MGLPVWRAPSPEKDALKVSTAPARSPIRRRSPFTGRRARPSRSPRSPRLLDNDFLVSASRLAHVEPIARPPSSRPRLPPPPAPESRNYSRLGDSARHTSSLPSDEDSLDRIRRERYYRPFYDSSLPSFAEVTRSSRQLPAFTPNFAPAAASRSSRHDSFHDPREPSAPRNRSPYYRASVDTPSARIDMAILEDGDDDSSDNNAVGFPPLRRMGRRTIADGPLPSSSLRESWSPATTLDGLGDRDRSISPIEDPWDTMLSTVAPDPLAPSVDSSFTSAAASASFSNSHPSSRAGSSNSNSAASSRTHLTVPSRRNSPGNELFFRACDTSDDDTASDTEEEEIEVRPDPSSLRRRIPRGYDAEQPPLRNPGRYSRGIRDRSREASAYVRSFYNGATRDGNEQPERPLNDQLDGPAEEPNTVNDDLPTLDRELRDARALLERLTRRDDISDEFWASVGLTRPLADRVERIQQRERL